MSSFNHSVIFAIFVVLLSGGVLRAAEPVVLNVWPDEPPDETLELPPEVDKTKDTDRLIAGRRIIKLGNVSTPQIAVYQPPSSVSTRSAIVICPGGGHYILAYDLEGTEVAQWLNSIGVTAVLLKYRVPFRHEDKRWLAAVQDAQPNDEPGTEQGFGMEPRRRPHRHVRILGRRSDGCIDFAA